MTMPLNDRNSRTIILNANTTVSLEAGFEITKVRFVIQDGDADIKFDVDVPQHRLMRLGQACINAAKFAGGEA